MRTVFVLVVALGSWGCSPIIGLIARAATAETGPETIHLGETVSGSTRGASDRWEPSCGAPEGGGDRAYAFVPEASGVYRIDVEASYDSVLAIFDDSDHALACNDDEGSTTRSRIEHRLEAGRRYLLVVDGYRGATGSFTLKVEQAPAPTPEQSEPRPLAVGRAQEGDTTGGTDHRTPPCGATPDSPDDLWTFTPERDGLYRIRLESSFDGVLAVYRRGAQRPLACNDDMGSTRASEVHLPLRRGSQYEVVVDGYHGATGAYHLAVSLLGPLPAPGRLEVGRPVRGDTRRAGDSRTPGCGGQPSGPDQTWSFTPAENGTYELRVDATFDAVLAVFAPGSAAPLQCNDDAGSPRISRLRLEMAAGRTYQVVVDGSSGQRGSYVLRAIPVRATAGSLTVGQVVQGNTTGGTDARTPSCGSVAGSPEQTWTFTPPRDGEYRFDLQSDFDAVLAVYGPGRDGEMACNDDFESARAARLDVQLSTGTSYEVVVDGRRSARGSYRLEVTPLGVTAPATGGEPEPAPRAR